MFDDPPISSQKIAILASISSLALLVNSFNWLRLFDSTSFYILLLGETLSDILPFMVLFVLSLMMLGVPMFMLDFNSEPIIDEVTGEEVSGEVIESLFTFWPSNMLLNEYMLTLGEFSVDHFVSHP